MSNNRRGEAEADPWTGDPSYIKGTYHFTVSSQQGSACVVEPGTPDDVGKIVRLYRSASGILHRHR